MDIQLFIQRRKSLGISQSELCQGICTQATLSRFENQGQVPSVKILLDLCQRLDMSLGELFPRQDVQSTELYQHIEAAENAFVRADYKLASQELAAVDAKQVSPLSLKKRYLYLKGFLAALAKASINDSFFYLNQLMTDLHTDFEPLYSSLAAAGLGLAYANAGESERAHHYFEKAQDGLLDYEPANSQELWRILNIILHTANFYATAQEYDQSDRLLLHGISLSSQVAVSHYVDRLYFRLAQNAEAQGLEVEQIKAYSADALAFAKFNGNSQLLARIKQFQSHI
ncbi:helix-turn-helix domain-containing protein [Abiotrophia defectiva]